MGPASSRMLSACALLFLGVIAFTAGVAQTGDDARNTAEDYWDAVNGAMCADHHAAEGFQPFGVSFTEHYAQLPVGEEVAVEVRVRHSSRMDTLHLIERVSVVLNLSDAPNVRVVTPESPGDVEQQDEVTLSHAERYEKRFPVYPGAVDGRVVVERLQPGPTGPLAGEWEAFVHDQPLTGSDDRRSRDLDAGILGSHGPGDWPITLQWRSPLAAAPGVAAAVPLDATFAVRVWVNHSAAATEYTFAPAEDRVLRLGNDDPVLVRIPIVLTGPGKAILDFRVEAWTIFDHPITARNSVDEGLFHRFITMQVSDGEDIIVAAQSFAPQPVGPVVDLYNLFTRILGFISLLLVLAALATGGVLGRRSRRALNRATGGARKRVLFHGATGFVIVVIATGHFLLALIENRNDVSQGLFWGGVAWFLLITLGFTGYYQARIIRRAGYRTWRHIHLWSAVGVLLFVVVHVVLEGSAFSTVREGLPSGYERLLWPPGPP